MAVLDFFRERLNVTNWLGFSNFYFDNALTIDVYASRGYVAYSPSKECFFCYTTLDSTNSALVEHVYNRIENRLIGTQQNICVIGDEHLQHFDLATYSHYCFYNDEQEETPWPKIPTKAELDAMTEDPVTGLFPGTDTLTQMNQEEISSIELYKDWDVPYSGAIVKDWKRFYKNQAKFVVMLGQAYGVTDAI